MPRLSFFVIFALLFAGCTKPVGSPGPQGNAVGIGGGDPLLSPLRLALQRLHYAVAQVGRGADLDQLCEPGPADIPASLSSTLTALTQAQRRACREFLARADVVSALSAFTSRPAESLLAIVDMDQTVLGPNGQALSVIATTALEEDGFIFFTRAGVKDLALPHLVQLLAHEIGHKIVVDGSHIADNAALTTSGATFSSGRLFLDALGAALAIHAELHVTDLDGSSRAILKGHSVGGVRALGANWTSAWGSILVPHSKALDDLTDGGNITFSSGGSIWGRAGQTIAEERVLEALPTDSPADVTEISVCSGPRKLQYRSVAGYGSVMAPDNGAEHWSVMGCTAMKPLRVLAQPSCLRHTKAFQCVGEKNVAVWTGNSLIASPGPVPNPTTHYAVLCDQIVEKIVCTH